MIPKHFPVTCHTKHVGPGSTFVAIKGFTSDGNDYIEQAIQRGAATIVTSEPVKKQYPGISIMYVKDTRKALAQLSAKTLCCPHKKLKLIGITGTKGKTTTTYLINHILQQAGYQTGLLGTIKNEINGNTLPATHTTPSSDYLHNFFDACVKQGVTHVIMEISAHALSLNRTHGILFDAVGFTNLAPEHLDFYKTMHKYFSAKYKLFGQIKKNGAIIVNKQNIWGAKAAHHVRSYKKYQHTHLHNFANQSLINIKHNSLLGIYNQQNITMAFLVCKQLGVPEKQMKLYIKNFAGVPGRLQKHVLKNGAVAFVDYAHDPLSTKTVLQTLRTKTKNLIVVFGCGGNRDKTKRPVMGKTASELADHVIVTNDNPRNENPESIIKEIAGGVTPAHIKKVECIADRTQAIAHAAHIATHNSIIAILGKGHETYQITKNNKRYFSDFEQVKRY